ncbi:3-oxoadipate enol-lactonase, partial [Rhizobium sp. Pop5]
PDCAHIPCVEQPEALTAIIRAFLTSLPSGEIRS